MTKENSYTPMFQQYLSIKRQYSDAILFFRAGDFYETFFEDAKILSNELDLVLTGKDSGKGRVPMAGIPHHAIDSYLPKLLNRGYKVAICEQMEQPSKNKKIIRREVTRIITPGTILESQFLEEKKNNYIAAIVSSNNCYGLAYADISTGELKVTEINNREVLINEIINLGIREIILPLQNIWEQPNIKETEWADIIQDNVTVSWLDAVVFSPQTAKDSLLKHFNINTLEGYGLENKVLGYTALWGLLHYISINQKVALNQFNSVQTYEISDYLLLDSNVCRNLELFQTIKDNTFKGSLLWVIDRTKTSMGARLLKSWLSKPLLSIDKIELRLDAVSELITKTNIRLDISELLPKIKDLERIGSRIATATVNARELVALSYSIKNLPTLASYCKELNSPLINILSSVPQELLNIAQEIEDVIVDNPPNTLTEGGLIKSGINKELDELRSLLSGDKTWVKNLEERERQRTGIKSLKIGYTKAFGYYIEITNTYRDQIPSNYIRKQTLVNAERYITPELKEKESKILTAEERIKGLEYEIFVTLRRKVSQYVPLIQDISNKIAVIDCLCSLAEVAITNKYIRPRLDNSNRIILKNSRHPVIEQVLPSGSFVPNDIYLDTEDNNIIILTGPNMAGKSTYLRQIGLIVILAQIGSFVPASEALIGIVDKIFTRIGAVDDISTGQSTFMVEMVETAKILNNATRNSLILLDEIGRGTSTFDGVSIAWSVSEYIANKIKARTIFATHYHELNKLSDMYSNISNYQVAVKETSDRVIFLYKVIEGGASRSYGIEVARLAGIPNEVITRAKEILNDIERRSRIQAGLQKVTENKESVVPIQMNLFNV